MIPEGGGLYAEGLEDIQQVYEAQGRISPSLVDFNAPREVGRAPSQASSDFLIHIEQGEWAESITLRAINEQCEDVVAVQYGKAGKKVAGEPGFAEFYDEYQIELDTLGKRPDILIFRRADFDENLGRDISDLPHDTIIDYVRKAVAGVEVRSSAYLFKQYIEENQRRNQRAIEEVLRIRSVLLDNEFAAFFSAPNKAPYRDILLDIDPENVGIITFRVPSWSATPEAVIVKNLLRELKDNLNILQKRENLSITPKVEDLKVVSRWIENTGVPHYYFQVFFDRVFGISYLDILNIVANEENEGVLFEVGGDVKNQNKSTIKIITEAAYPIASHVTEPKHHSKRRELNRGRLLFYVSFSNGSALLDCEALYELIGLGK